MVVCFVDFGEIVDHHCLNVVHLTSDVTTDQIIW
jgi:hypothetical protein